jgi:hypothetical protein
MLYDRPTLRWMNEEGSMAACIMLGNGGAPEMNELVSKHKTNVKPWIFWPRDAKVYLKSRKVESYENRKRNIVFIGNYENAV